jgi:hypothetical protein
LLARLDDEGGEITALILTGDTRVSSSLANGSSSTSSPAFSVVASAPLLMIMPSPPSFLFVDRSMRSSQLQSTPFTAVASSLLLLPNSGNMLLIIEKSNEDEIVADINVDADADEAHAFADANDLVDDDMTLATTAEAYAVANVAVLCTGLASKRGDLFFKRMKIIMILLAAAQQ